MVDCSLICIAPTEHLKMMRLLFLCLLLLLPAATALSEESEGSADDDMDDEDLYGKAGSPEVQSKHSRDSTVVGKTTGEEEKSDQLTLIIIVVAVAVVALSVAAIVTIVLIKRRIHSRQQGVYSVPTEQDQKGAV
ncbi:uncharacterized protein [Trachinotus anak]|uniref:uncharacterized protein isoform X1 n=2 Tax=Trachinotus anak TaxID=443729 RepID=UPI0039F17FB4